MIYVMITDILKFWIVMVHKYSVYHVQSVNHFMYEQHLRKKSRIKKQAKRTFTKSTGTLSQQMNRVSHSKGYKNSIKKEISIKFSK